MKRFITMGSIEQFSTVIKNVKRTAQFVSYNEETKEVTVDRDAKMPVITATGSEKIHGTNAGFSYNEIDGEWYQSRKNIITPEKDNAGCAFFLNSKKDIFIETIKKIAEINDIDLNIKGIVLFGEWAGGNIQKKSALTGLNKKFIVFQYAKVYNIEQTLDKNSEEEANYWIETKLS